MHAHRVEVFNRADDDAIVCAVPHHFHFIFFPSQQGFINQHLGHGGHVEPAGDDGFEFLAVIGDTAAGPAEGEAGADDERERADFRGDAAGDFHALFVIEAVFFGAGFAVFYFDTRGLGDA